MKQEAIAETPDVCVIVVNWNSAKETVECVRSVLDLAYPRLQAVVVDNGSTSEDAANLRNGLQDYPEAALIPLEENRGWAAGLNMGLREGLKGDFGFFFILNNDTRCEGRVLEELVRYMVRNRGVGIAGPTVASMGLGRGLAHQKYEGIRTPIFDEELTGSAFLVRREVIEKVGFFDTTWFVYCEELDYYKRTIDEGFTVMYLPTQGQVRHRGGYSTERLGSERATFYYGNRFLFLRRYNPSLRAIVGHLLFVLKITLFDYVSLEQRKAGLAAIARGLRLLVANPPVTT